MHRRALAGFVVGLSACRPAPDAKSVAPEIEQRTGHRPDLERTSERAASLPPGIVIDDGISADDAVAIAVWNSARLRVDLARLGIGKAELADARRPTNPTLRVLFPAGPQQLAMLLTWPLESFVGMRRRVALAHANADVVAHSVVQTALDLTRDARLAHAEWVLAQDRREVRRLIATHLDEIATIAEARGAAGDVPLREGDAARADALAAHDDAKRAEHDVAIAELRLRFVMGWSPRTELRASAEPVAAEAVPALPQLEEVALGSRPDLRAARLAIDAAKARVAVERIAALRFAGVANVQGRSITGGVQAELPIANQNQGGIGRARADLDAASWRHEELRTRVVAEVGEAHALLQRAHESLRIYRDTIVVARERDIDVVTAAYELGEQDYTAVLLAAQRLETARLRDVELAADVRRARAELERALGRRLATIGKGRTR